MNAIDEENYTIVRTLIQIRRTKHNDPSRKKDHLGFGFLGRDFFKVLLGPMMESKKTRSDADIQLAVNLWCNGATRAEAEDTYGHISRWDTSNVTNMNFLFEDKSHFNDDISAWNVSSVTDMSHMFTGADAFHCDVSAWNWSSVTKVTGTSVRGNPYKWEGEVLNGLPHGNGTMTSTSGPHKGDVYVGACVAGRRTGEGHYVWSSGNEYNGSWLDDAKSGFGVHTSKNGQVYSGQYANDKRNGRGTISEGGFVLFEGQWTNGHKQNE